MNSSERILTLVALAFTAAVTIATSKASDGPGTPVAVVQTYLVTSNCAGAVPQDVIKTRANEILDPAGRDFTAYGLPVAYLNIGQGELAAGSRRCTYSVYQTSPTFVHLYSCYDNGALSCLITFEYSPNGSASGTPKTTGSSAAPKDPSDPR